MGSAVSKGAKSYPKRPSQPAWAGARTDLPPSHNPAQPRPPRASESKTAEIDADARDPHLGANLARLGQVRVPYASQAVRASKDIRASIDARQQSEVEASSNTPVRNRLDSPTLIDLFDDRKKGELPPDAIAAKYGIDRQLFNRLVKHFNSPSGGESVPSRAVTAEGEQLLLTKAKWVDPPRV